MSSKKYILITGGLGFIGSHTIIELLNSSFLSSHKISLEFEPVIVDGLFNSSEKVLDILKEMTGKNIPFHKVDLCEKDKLEDIFKKYPFEYVIHFAGFKSVNESIGYPLEYYRNNLLSTLNLVELCVKYKCNNFIFSSSCTVYGNACDRAREDSTNLIPTNPYGRTKLYIENILKDTCRVYKDFKVLMLRYANPVSAHPSGKLGEAPNPKSRNPNLFPILEQCIRGEREKVVIFGNDYPTRDGTCIRDYIHVTDIGQAHVLSLTAFTDPSIMTSSYLIFNVGSDKGYSVKEVIDAYNSILTDKIKVEIGQKREGDAAIASFDCSKFYQCFKWKPKFSLEDMCRDSLNFVKKNPKGIF